MKVIITGFILPVHGKRTLIVWQNGALKGGSVTAGVLWYSSLIMIFLFDVTNASLREFIKDRTFSFPYKCK